MLNYGLYFLLSIFAFLFARNLFSWTLSINNSRAHRQRRKQLNFDNEKNTDVEELIETLCKPANKYILPELREFDEESLKQQLAFIGWDKYFTPKLYVSFRITFKILAIIIGLILAQLSVLIGLIWGVVLFIGLDTIFDNKIQTKRDLILADFPNFLRITQGFLSSGQPLIISLEQTIKYLSPEWQELISNFVVDYTQLGMNPALDNLKNATGMFEVRKFAAMLKLSLKKGQDVREGFELQAKGIKDIQTYILERKIAKRKALAMIIQAPLFIAIFVAFGLPIVGDMTQMGMF